ncbi:unnamed protein product [Arctia plantaginis]|uniref:DNA ligase 4 n=1 Tax=Arctia plantaginis TaxID=874455 RepID=A0A8S1A8T1_ARCPL|nr:unnamed protein product [Arctia plantaginis]
MPDKVTPVNNIKFEKFCGVLEQLHKRKKLKKVQDTILSDFINDCKLTASQVIGGKNASLFPILRLILPKLERERKAYNLKESKLGALLVKILSLPKNSRDAQKLLNFRSANDTPETENDFATVAYYVVKSRLSATPAAFTIGDINSILDRIASAEIGEVKATALDETFSHVVNKLNPDQLKWFLRIILKDLKLGMSDTRILAIFHTDAPEYYKNCSDLLKVCDELEDGDTRLLELGIQMFSAVCPMMSERLDVKHTAKLAPSLILQIEKKFDGERFQIHMENGVFEYFSRKGHKYSSKFGNSYESGMLTPFLKNCFKSDTTSFILDGEMMGWHKEHQYFGCKGMAFDIKKITENSKFRPCFCAFDILYYNGRTLVGPPEKGGLPLSERLRILDALFVNVTGVIQHSERQIVKDRSEILEALETADKNQEEGIVVKDVASYYIPNKRNAGWYKIKPEYTDGAMEDLDLVIIGADEAANKRRGRAKNFLVACLDAGESGNTPDRWVGVGHVSTGLSFENHEALCTMLERNWTPFKNKLPPSNLVFHKEKPDFWVLPENSVVLTVRATELIASSSYGAGYTLRFPRVIRVRDDKPVRDIMTLTELRQFISNKGGGVVTKLSTNNIGEEEIPTEVRVTRKRKTEPTQVAEQFLIATHGGVEATSKALLGRKIAILSDDEDCKSQDLAKIVETHGGTVVANSGPDTWVSIAGRMTKLVRTRIASQTADIITTAWLRSLPTSSSPIDLCPLDMLAVKSTTKLALARKYDPFGDSYSELIDEATLRRCFDKMDSDHEPIHLTSQEMLALDTELFDDTNPNSFLRPYHIHITNCNSISGLLAKMYGATLYDAPHKDCTHIVVSDPAKRNEIENAKRHSTALVVSKDWLEACFARQKYVPEIEFIL